jgi:hypothetical protein
MRIYMAAGHYMHTPDERAAAWAGGIITHHPPAGWCECSLVSHPTRQHVNHPLRPRPARGILDTLSSLTHPAGVCLKLPVSRHVSPSSNV